jgi:hypothetical protein
MITRDTNCKLVDGRLKKGLAVSSDQSPWSRSADRAALKSRFALYQAGRLTSTRNAREGVVHEERAPPSARRSAPAWAASRAGSNLASLTDRTAHGGANRLEDDNAVRNDDGFAESLWYGAGACHRANWSGRSATSPRSTVWTRPRPGPFVAGPLSGLGAAALAGAAVGRSATSADGCSPSPF